VAQTIESNIVVRPVRERDVEAIVHIDTKITGEKRAGLWRGILAAYVAGEGEQQDGLSPELCQVAEVDGKVVGFMVGDIQAWQFGMPRCGRIVTLGVHPDYRRRGLGTRLIEAMFDTFRKFRVPDIQCLVAPADPLAEFFAAHGLESTSLVVMGRRL
jgi:ribosomal protein S18 acetylase RimI-like enzyme